MHCKEKWCTAGGKDPLFGRVNGFQIDPKMAKENAPMNLTCTAARSGRLSSFLRRELKMSSGLMNRLKWNGGICVNGLPQIGRASCRERV